MRYALTGGHVLIPDESPIITFTDSWAQARDFWSRLFGPMFAGFRPDEGDLLAINLMLRRVFTDRDADLELGLFTNTSPAPKSTTEKTSKAPNSSSESQTPKPLVGVARLFRLRMILTKMILSKCTDCLL